MDDRNVQIEAVDSRGSGWKISGPSFSVTCRPPGRHRSQWQMAVECGELVEQLNEDGQIVARRKVTRYAIGDNFSEVLPVLQDLDSAARQRVAAVLSNQLGVEASRSSVTEAAA